MTDLPPPYRPLRGAPPPHFVDRHDEDDPDGPRLVAGAVTAYQRGPADPRFHRLVSAPAGLGKTSLLRTVGREAVRQLGWTVVQHRCRPKQAVVRVLSEAVLAELGGAAREGGRGRLAAMARHPSVAGPLLGPLPGPRLGPLSGPARAGAPSLGSPAEAPWAAFGRLMRVVGRVCQGRGEGVLLTLDDADRLGAGDLEALVHLCRTLSAEQLPVAFLLAGGGDLAGRAVRAQGLAGTIWLTHLPSFDDAESREAVVVPAADRGVDLEEAAVGLLCDAAAGSPLDLQRLAFGAWSRADGPVVRLADVEAALASECWPEQRPAC